MNAVLHITTYVFVRNVQIEFGISLSVSYPTE